MDGERLRGLKPGITWPQARAAFAVEVELLSSKQEGDSSNLRPSITSLQIGLAAPVKNASLMFMGAVVLVLLIACTNVTNLSIARTSARQGRQCAGICELCENLRSGKVTV